MNALADQDLTAAKTNVLSRGKAMVGAIPADRMIVNPALDVPRYVHMDLTDRDWG